jgi:nicotinate-nucleotide adenylyltransferase
MTKTGLLFGSFNPVHIGHIAIAGYIKEFAGLEEIWFIVSPQNPHKSQDQLAGPLERLHMVRLAIKGFPSFMASDIEFGMPLPSYTLNTLQKMTATYKERDFYLIIGTDNIESISSWKGFEILLRDYKFLIYPRLRPGKPDLGNFVFIRGKDSPGAGSKASPSGMLPDPRVLKKARFNPSCDEYDLGKFANASIVKAPVIEVSSTFIREAISEGKDMRAFVPAEAYDYLMENRIYR